MKFTTKTNIEFPAWINQTKRFARIEDGTKQVTMPIDTDFTKQEKTTITAGKGVIVIKRLQDLSLGFKANVRYIQNYSVTIQDVPVQDLETNETTTQDVTTDYTHQVVSYDVSFDRATTQHLMAQIDGFIPAEVKCIDRNDAIIKELVMQDILSHNTFDSLPREDYLITD